MIDKILIRGAKVHNLKQIDVDIPLGKIVGIAGVSGSGKSSLALGVLYAEGSRRYLEALSTYTRRRMTQASKASVDEVLYVLDEPSIGLHPSNLVGLTGVMHDLVADGNSVILVDHDTQILREADWIIEMGPEAGAKGGHVIAQGTIPAIEENPASQIGPVLSGKADAKEKGYKASDFSYNTGSLRCPGCDGTGVISLDVQFLPDVNIPCPDCRGSRYARSGSHPQCRLHHRHGARRRRCGRTNCSKRNTTGDPEE